MGMENTLASDSPHNCEDCGDSGMVCVGDRGEDFCVCETGHRLSDEFYSNDEGYQMSDVEADADTLSSCGWGTDEDYGGGMDYL